MTSPPAPAPPPPPSWQHCGDPLPGDPVGCRGIHVSGHARCLAHLTSADRAAYLAGVAPGDDVDHRGTPFTTALLDELLDALRDPVTRKPRMRAAWFSGATFTGDADFAGASFGRAAWFVGAVFTRGAWFDEVAFGRDARFGRVEFGHDARFGRASFGGDTRFGGASFGRSAWFAGATFTGDAHFPDARFLGDALFDRVTFTADARFDRVAFTGETRFGDVTFGRDAWFGRALFGRDARFADATFTRDARFGAAVFAGDAGFGRASFAGDAWFVGATFARDARFDGAVFTRAAVLGPLVCARTLHLDAAVFGAPVTVEAAAGAVACRRTRWDSTATLRLRYAELDLTDAVPHLPVAVTSQPAPFADYTGAELAEPGLGGDPKVRILSLCGVDAAHLLLTDTDLTHCLLTGAFHLDQLRLEGDTVFAAPPTGWRLRSGVPARLARRRAVAEEHHWRALGLNNPAPPRGWTPGPGHGDPALTPGPNHIAPVYRALRKASEDAKNEPDAADFYYGEMEMRRHDRQRPFGERALITGYWLLSGYGLRASRALGWLLFAMAATVLSLMLWGLPTNEAKPHTTGVQARPGERVDLVTDTPAPVLDGTAARVTAERAEKATRVVVNSVVFRSSGQNLTTAGTYIEMASRFLEPVLLGLAVLAIRGRVKR